MFDFIRGKISYVGDNFLVLENSNIGFKIYTSGYSMYDLNNKKDDAVLYTHLIVRDDDISLCGFSTREELRVFDMLKTVKGVGTKVALGVLSAVPFNQLITILSTGDEKQLTKAPGIGKKTAQRIILELKDKITELKALGAEMYVTQDLFTANDEAINNGNAEALDALTSLGYSKAEAERALTDVDTSLPIEEVLKLAFRAMMK